MLRAERARMRQKRKNEGVFESIGDGARNMGQREGKDQMGMLSIIMYFR